MTAEEHNKTLATLHFVYGGIHGLTLAGLALLIFVVRLAAPVSFSISAFWLTIASITFIVVLVAVVLLPLAVAYGLLKRRKWARPIGLTLAVLSLINIPIGTALGIYTIKFFKSEGGAKLFGGKASGSNENELPEALRGAQPLMNWADKLK